jgi:hypothetical protein
MVYLETQGLSRVEALKERKKGNRPHVDFLLDCSFFSNEKKEKNTLIYGVINCLIHPDES